MVIRDIDNLTFDDMKPIALSFKKNEDELELYKWIMSHSGKSNFIKDKLREAKAIEEGNITEGKSLNTKPTPSVNHNNLIDF